MDKRMKVLIAVLIVVGLAYFLIIPVIGLYYLGLMNPAAFTGQRVTGFPNLGSPVEWTYSSDGGFSITLKNGLGNPITISEVTANCGKYMADVTFQTDHDSAEVNPGESVEYHTSDCQDLVKESSYLVPFTVTYMTQSASYSRQDTGTVTGKAV